MEKYVNTPSRGEIDNTPAKGDIDDKARAMIQDGAEKAKGFLAEFKAFALKGNVVDMAVGVVIGMAFKGIVDALVNSVLMPFVGLFTGGLNFSAKAIDLGHGNMLVYGALIQSVISFVIIAFVIFLLVKIIGMLRLKGGTAEEPPADATEIELLAEIRDLLKEQAGK